MNRSRSQAKARPPYHLLLNSSPSCLSFCLKINHSVQPPMLSSFFGVLSFVCVCVSGTGVGKGGGGVSIFWAMFPLNLCVTRQFWSKFSQTFLGKCAYAVDYEDLIWCITKSLLIVRVGLDLQVGSCVYRMSKAMGCYLLPPMGCYKLK